MSDQVDASGNDITSLRQLILETSPLLLGIAMLLLGVGLQGTLLGVRASMEGFSMMATGLVMSTYYIGFLFGALMVPKMISKVGHIRIFAALGAAASTSILLHAVFVSPEAWVAVRLLSGFCFSGVYIVAESWLNDRAPNHLRGQLLAIYMIVHLSSMAAGQYLLMLADPGGMLLFVMISVLVSIAIVPCAVSSQPVPEFQHSQTMSVKEVAQTSPLGTWAVVISGLINGFIFGMGAVYGQENGLSLVEISTFIAVYVTGGALLQWPLGWLSDIMNRRLLLIFVALVGGVVALIFTAPLSGGWVRFMAVTMVVGASGMALYSLGVAMVNDRLPAHQMVAASGGLIFLNGFGAAIGPVTASWAMETLGSDAFFGGIGVAGLSVAILGILRFMPSRLHKVVKVRSYQTIIPRGSDIALGAASETAIELVEEDDG